MSGGDGRYDLVAIGGGTAALVACLGVAGLGGRAALIEADRVGGDCLWTGCVPSKALLAAAAAADTMRHADRFGLTPARSPVDLAAVMAGVRRAQSRIEPHDSPDRLRAQGVDVIHGHGRFTGPGRIEVGERTLRYRSALIATGSRPAVPPVPGLVEAGPLTSSTFWQLDRLPARLVVLGGGPIGCELGQAMARLGSSVTIVEAEPTLLPRESPDVGRWLAHRLAADGVTVRAGVRAERVGPEVGQIHLSDGTTIGFDAILVATGRTAATSELGLDMVGVGTDERGYVEVDPTLRTTGRRIFAAGDVTGAMPLTPVAAYQARIVVANALLGARRKVSYDHIPWVTFTDPEVARIGLDAAAARARFGSKAVVQRFDYAGLDRAVTAGRAEGWAELVGDPKRRLVGATVVGAAAGESIAELAAWMVCGRRIDQISTTVHAYPTFSEGPSRAADDLLRARWFNPRVTRISRPVLGLLRRLDAVRGS